MRNKLKIKVCGMKHPENIKAIDVLGVDYIGLIFHQPSKRYVKNEESIQIPETKAKRVGVFTHHSLTEIAAIAHLFGLKIIQLHGSYSPSQVDELKKLGFEVWKCFHVDAQFDARKLASYSNADAFIFDTAGALLGGNGYAFDWQMLHQMHINRPFLLSGGISPASIQALKTFNHPQLLGLDLNSQFEIEPALKNDSLIQTFINQLPTL
jgi:phosphoribosylanthranilate isomerase